MPRDMDRRLVMAHERANPVSCDIVDISAPDVGQVLRRAADQFLTGEEAPPNSLTADPAGALTLGSTTANLASFIVNDDYTTTHIDANGLSDNQVRGLCWTVDPAFGRAILRKVTVHLKREVFAGLFKPNNRVGLQIYRRDNAGPDFAPFIESTWTPLLPNVVWWQPKDASWSAINQIAVPEPFFDLTGLNVVVGSGLGPNAKTEYYFVLSIDQGQDNYYLWARDRTTSRTIAGVGVFSDRQWFVRSGTKPSLWVEDLTLPAAVPTATMEIEHFATTSQIVYPLDLGGVPSAESVGRVVFERGLPTGTEATLELSTTGETGPWVDATDGDVVTTKQQTYHARLTLTAPANRNVAPRVFALGVQFRTEVDVSAEAIVEHLPQEIGVPWCDAAIGEGSVTVIRTGARDYRDQATELATRGAVTQLEVDVRLGSRHPLVTRDAWMLIDRATVNNRTPTSGAEQFALLSILKRLKQKIPARAETFNTVHTVTGCSTAGGFSTMHVTPAIPLAGNAFAYLNQGYYMRVRSSAQPGVESGFVATIYNNSGAGWDLLSFTDSDTTSVLPNDLAIGDVIEIHSARFARPTLSWKDADPADAWWELFTVWLGIPSERIGRGDMGRGGRPGLPPRVEDIEPDDVEHQDARRVTLATEDAESGADLINQLSFLMGGTTIDVGGQIVFRQIYPLRNANGDITVQPDPLADTFDVRDTIGLQTPTGLEQRIAQLACNYGVDTTAGDDPDTAPLTSLTADADAIAYLEDQPVDEMAPSEIPAEIARWCYNSADAGLYLADKLTEMVVRACSTGLRVWSWGSTDARPKLVPGDRVAVITDQYTDFDPSRDVTISGLMAFSLVLTSVTAGGRAFRGWLQSLTDGLPIKGGPGTLAAAPDATAGEILSVTFKDSVDGTQRTYDVTCGAAVATLYVHHRLWPVGTQGDPFQFTSGDDRELIVVRPDPSDGHFRFTLVHPDRRVQRMAIVAPRRGAPDFAMGAEVYKIVLDPAPPAMSAKMHAAVVNGAADVSVDVSAGVSDWPVRARIYEGSPNTTPLVDVTLNGPRTLDKISYPALGGRALPLRELLSWWTQLTNVAGEEQWGGPEAANRDPLPQGYITVETNRADAKIRMVFDTDTDGIRVTVPSGKTKTWTSGALASAGSPVVYTVGDLLDDATTESALSIDEKRGTYLVEYQGGGQWVTIAPPFVLSGALSSAALVVTVTPGSSSYSIVWSGSGVTVSIDGGGYGTPSPSPIVVTRDTSSHTYDFKQVSGNTSAPVHIDVPAIAPASAASFSALSNVMFSEAADQVRFSWTYSVTPDSFDVYVMDTDLGTGPYEFAGNVASSPFTYTALENIQIATGAGTVKIGFYVVPITGSNAGGASARKVTTYNVATI